MSLEKYRVHEVAKDLGKSTKEITQILTTYATTPKNHMQVLDDKELSLIFEHVTQKNQVADMQASLGAPAKKEKTDMARNDRPNRDRKPEGGQNQNRGRNDRNDRPNREGGQNRGPKPQNNNQQAAPKAPAAPQPQQPTTRGHAAGSQHPKTRDVYI